MHQELDRKRRANKLISDALARRGVQARNIETKTSLRDDLGDASRQLASAETKVREARECLLELQKRFLVMSLRFNYRCKAGIAATASSVSQLLLERFPRAADFIQEETTTPGSKPLFVRLPSNSLLSLYLLGKGDSQLPAVDPTCTALLVRNDRARNDLRKRIQGLILTPAEAKGLEFDLVILVNLFSSGSDEIWDLADDESSSTQLARADANQEDLASADKARLWRIALAIPEFKTLYVAISRARSGCVFLETESSSTSRQSMLQRHT
ncbi:Trank1 [Symbiodinium pilosum]|uniref:Trank1 protein n=1 Tax=Symbiodinium pilosum TaxID=2952 RepID=A0A812SM64_SYMPI|nr:Trank1 [Symbiodinium pilosum]